MPAERYVPLPPIEDSPLLDPRVAPDSFVVYPTGYDEFVNSDKHSWCLTVRNGHAWGWWIDRGMGMSGGGFAMNRRGQWILESRGNRGNKARRWPLEEALRIALEHVDTHKLNGVTAAEASADVAARSIYWCDGCGHKHGIGPKYGPDTCPGCEPR